MTGRCTLTNGGRSAAHLTTMLTVDRKPFPQHPLLLLAGKSVEISWTMDTPRAEIDKIESSVRLSIEYRAVGGERPYSYSGELLIAQGKIQLINVNLD